MRSLLAIGDPRYAVKRTVRPRGDGLLFEVVYEYNDQATFFENPLNDPDQIEWGAIEGSEPYEVDRDPAGPKPVVNSAGQAFDSSIERENSNMLVTVRRNVATFNATQANTYRDAVNAASFTVDGVLIPEGAAKIGAITCGGRQMRGGVSFREMVIPIKIRQDWLQAVYDTGYYQIDGSDLVPITDSAALPVEKPWPLDGAGAAKANATDVPAILTFYPYKKLAFSAWSFT